MYLFEFCREKSDGEVDSHAVGLIMTMLSVSYKKAVDIWKMQCLAERELGTVPQKRKPATSVLYPDVPANDQEIFAAMSDVQRNKYALLKVGGLQRLTWSRDKGYHRQDMQCPEMAREYNQEGMGGGDSNDRMKLARRTSCEMNLVSKRWDWRLFWGLMDIDH